MNGMHPSEDEKVKEYLALEEQELKLEEENPDDPAVKEMLARLDVMWQQLTSADHEWLFNQK